MTLQRRRAQEFVLYPIKQIADYNENLQWAPDLENPIEVKGWIIPLRGTLAEIPGQQLIDVLRIGLDADLTNSGLEYDLAGFGVYGRAVWRSHQYDVIAPPVYHHGTRRHTRHWSVDIRKRP